MRWLVTGRVWVMHDSCRLPNPSPDGGLRPPHKLGGDGRGRELNAAILPHGPREKQALEEAFQR